MGRRITSSKAALIMSCVAVMAWLFVAPKNAAAQSATSSDQAEYNTVELLRLMDKDQNGNVSLEEFHNYMNKEFDSLDVNHDGQLDENELARLHWNYLSTQLLPLMDEDHSGKVSREEFMSFMDREFYRLDINHNGRLDVDELAAMHFAHMGRK
jgi:Ca2+-binding EF-hand superfamily protein